MNKRKVGSKNPSTSYPKAKEGYSSPQAVIKLSAEGFLKRLKQMEGNLENRHYHVTEEVCIGNEFSNFSIHLGCGVFEKSLSVEGVSLLRTLSLGSSTIEETLSLKTSHISILNFGSAEILGQASLDDITSNGIDFGQAHFNGGGFMKKVYSTGPLNLGGAVFESGLSLDDVGAASINAGSANLGKLTLKELYFGTFYTETATASKLTIQGDKLSFRGNLLDTSRILTQLDSEANQNSLETRLALAIEAIKNLPSRYSLVRFLGTDE
ncbi:hypothetical protein HXK74_02385 [Candidatus Gracilibacteria bacterium]|nr:hypothetical protein [Candidatus Gracilibacteria bacterium]